MKISCQSCHSKYNVADEKVQGKIVKIRCRKCGATIVVNGSSAAASTNGSGAAAAPAAPATQGAPSAIPTAGEGGGAEWHVSVSESDQRTMTLAELVEAYHTGVVTQDTFVWSDGMDDWKPLGEIDAVVTALHAAAEPAAAAAPVAAHTAHASRVAAPGATAPLSPMPPMPDMAPPPEPAPIPPAAYERPAPYAAGGGGLGAQAVEAAPASAEPRRAAVKREQRSRDLFATRTGEELRTSGAGEGADDGRLTGQRNENSVLFSLEHLTKNAEERAQEEPARRNTEDSGIIDLKALAAKAESLRPAVAPDMSALSAPIGYSAPLGTPLGVGQLGSESKPKSKLPLLLGGGVGIAILLVLGIGIGLKLGGSPAAAVSATASAPILPLPSATAAATAEPSASASAAASPSASAAPSSVAATTPKPHVAGGGGAGGAGAPGGGAWHAGGQ
ncbi:MAG: zinc-ribbon domain-containing protein, partial [Myxococcales bacterium]|nr:zinc-ribbon domain-containing protein [Myxococcales bacterium]